MAYFTIENFAAGLDLRRNSLTAPPGTLRVLKNMHVTPGGEIEKRFAFTKIKTVAASSRGLVEQNQKVYVIDVGGPGKVDPTGPFDVGQLKLQTAHIEKILDYDLFNNRLFVVAQLDNAATPTVQCYYDGILNPAPPSEFCLTYKTKMHTVKGSVLQWSDIMEATDTTIDWTLPITDPTSLAGNLDLALYDSDMTSCQALEAYYDKLAIFSQTACQLWSIDPDPDLNQYQQTLRQAGTIAPRSVLQYGSGDILYLAPDGIRSLRARNSSLAASVSDIGSPLDPVIQDLFRTKGQAWLFPTQSLLQPVAGRFWVILPDRIFVLSAFPGPKITAWSQYDPGFNILAACVAGQRVYVRDDANNVYVYGGTDPTAPTYDNCPTEIVFPFHPVGENLQASFKRFHGIDAACVGQFDVFASYDPTTEAEDHLGVLDGPSYLQGRFPIEGHGTHISLRLRSLDSSTPGAQLLSNLVIHYDLAETG